MKNLNLSYIVIYTILIMGILVEKGIKLHRWNSNLEESMYFAIFLGCIGLIAEYFLYIKDDKSIKLYMKIFCALVCKAVALLGLGYLILYWTEIYNNSMLFVISLSSFILCSSGNLFFSKGLKMKETS